MAYHIEENCIGCTACAKTCPVSAITGDRKKRHVINEKRCVECGVCGRTCPNHAITDGLGKACAAVPRTQWKKPEIDKRTCSACGICVSICRFKALAITLPAVKGSLRVTAELSEPSKCVGCALCSRECPLKIIAMKGGGVV